MPPMPAAVASAARVGARLVSGDVEMETNYALEPDELAAGVFLTCQAHPVGDELRLEFL